MKLHLIFARARNGVIGKDGKLPWHLPEDLAHFKRTTLGCPVIMGRKTWDSLPPKFRPLPGRTNIVITRQTDWEVECVKRVESLDQAISLVQDQANVWVIGGALVYAQTLPLAESVVVTHIDADFDGDAFAPNLGPEWIKDAGSPQKSINGLTFSIATYRRLAHAHKSFLNP
jgi:dihydrofolate reductase